MSHQAPTPLPSALDRAADAMDLLKGTIELSCLDPQPTSHWGVLVSGIDEPVCVSALGVYATALIAQIVRVDVVLSDALIGDPVAFATALRRNVQRTIGDSNELTDNFREYQRDPWITEAIAHLLFALAREELSDCVPGPVRALTLPHTQVREQGLDLIGVFELEEGAGICVTESKASEEHANSQLAKATTLFKTLDTGDRDEDLLRALNLFTAYLSPGMREAVPNAMWSGERSYAPLLTFRTNFNAASERPNTLGLLAPPVDRRRLIAIELQTYSGFFNDVADAMRAAVVDY